MPQEQLRRSPSMAVGRPACFDLVPSERAVSVLEQDILMVFTEHFLNILGTVQEHTAHHGSPRPLKTVTVGGLVTRVAPREQILWARFWIIRHSTNLRSYA